jgi:D-aminoacyl-tRNA deacylase
LPLIVSPFSGSPRTFRRHGEGQPPSFSGAARPEAAEPLYERFCEALEGEGARVARGVFGARMLIEIENDGPVTIVLET